MTHRRPKKRALSDIEQQPTSTQQCSTSSRRKSTERQARLVTIPFFVPSYLESNNLTTGGYSPNNLTMNGYNISNQTQICTPQITNDSIYFTLPPNANLPFNFTIDLSANPGRKKISMMSNFANQISFIINQTSFFNCSLPVDMTNYIVNGTNGIVFSTFGLFQPILIQIKITDQINIEFDINTLIQNIVNNHSVNLNDTTINNNNNNHSISNNDSILMNNDEAIDFSYLVDPISKEEKRIDIAVRGQQCKHYRCFDLRSFLERANYANNWNCPYCGQFISAQELRVERHYTTIIERKLQQNEIRKQQLNEIRKQQLNEQQNLNFNLHTNMKINVQQNRQQISHMQHDDIFEEFLDGNNLDDVFSGNF